MNRKNLISVIVFMTIVMGVLAACGGNSPKTESSTSDTVKQKASKQVSGTNTQAAFNKKVDKICRSMDSSVFAQINGDPYAVLADIEGYKKSLQSAEDEFDNMIAKMKDVNPPAKYSDDWDVLIEDFEAYRDAFPKLGTMMGELAQMMADIQADPNKAAASKARTDEIQAELEGISQDLDHRASEISEITLRLGIKDCSVN